MPHPTYLYLMKNLLIAFLFNFLCVSVQGATLDFAFQLGEKQEPRLDKLLSDVVRQMAFSRDSKKLIAKGMGGTVVEWDIQSRQKREISYVRAKRWFAYSIGTDQMLARDADDNITILSLGNGDEALLTNGQYESGSLSADSTLAVLSRGDNEVEVWQLTKQDSKTGNSAGFAHRLKCFRQVFPSGTVSPFLITVNSSPPRKELTERVRDIGRLLRFGTQPMNVR